MRHGFDVLAAPANPIAAVIVMLAWLAFGMRLIQLRRASAVPAVASARRDAGSWWGILLQGVAIGITFFGQIKIERVTFDPTTLATAALPVVLALGGLWLFDSAARELGRNWSLVARLRDDHALVTTGAFALVRNPIYLAMLLMMIGAGIALGHLLQLTIAVPLFFLATATRVEREERLLRAAFGPAFDAYASKVSRLIPGIW